MSRTKVVLAALTCAAMYFSMGASDCEPSQGPAQSASGVDRAVVKVQTGADGMTAEQRNVRDRLTQDNKPGAIQHLYIISAYSGDVIMYSTVRGKVTSSSKRLNPETVSAASGTNNYQGDFIPWGPYRTSEVLQDDGTYGKSVEYIYWWDSKGIYHQQYVTGGMIVHISSEPIAVSKVVLNLEARR